MSFQFPQPGDIQGSIQKGNDLINQIQGAANDPSAAAGLLEAGISLAGNAVGGPGGSILTSAVAAGVSGFAMAGPMGAVAGAIFALAEGVLSMFQGANAVIGTVGVSAATQTITAAVQAMASQHPDILTGKPQGWAMADWMAFARPPSSTHNTKGFFNLMQAVSRYIASTIPPGSAAFSSGHVPYSQNDSGDPSNIANALCGTQWQISGANCNKYTPSQFARWQKPLCTPVWFDWYQSNQIVDCDKDLFFGDGGAGGSVDELKQRWIQSTYAQNGMSQEQIVDNAIAHMIDPMYFGSDLYGVPTPSGFSGYGTVYYNTDLMNGIATVLMMRSAGALTKSIAAELMIQSAILAAHGAEDPSGNPMPGDVSLNQYGFHHLLNDHLRMVQEEEAGLAVVPVSTDLSLAAKIGIVTAAASGAVLVGVLGYSAVTKTSPRETTRLAIARTRRLFR
jgi:hypothetical protein